MIYSPPTRRSLMQMATAFGAIAAVPKVAQAFEHTPKALVTKLDWMEKRPPSRFDGTTLGVPWPKGMIKAGTSFRLGEIPVQSWPLAYWPDGSLKWTGHAIAGDTKAAGREITVGTPAAPTNRISVTQTLKQVTVTSGDLVWQIPTSGAHLIASASRAGRETLKDLSLVALTQDQPDLDATGAVKQTRYVSNVQKVTVEQSGPVRAVVKIDGLHSDGARQWLPFSVRLYFYAGSDQARIVHSFVYDGDATKDYIRGLGVTAKAPMADQSYDRHIRFSGEGEGVWGEAVRPITGLRRDPGQAYKDAQVAGKALPDIAGMDKAVSTRLQWIPEWGDFTLTQHTSDGFRLKKRTRSGHAWVESNSGTRSKGLVYVGGASGGVALGQKDFWQRETTQLDVRNAHTDMAEVTAWLYSPEAPAMDMRSYRSVDGMETYAAQVEGLNITYEDYEPGWDSAYGVARTSELNLWILDTTPSYEAFSGMAESVANPARLSLSPARIKEAGVFGFWSLVDNSTPARKIIEDRLSYMIEYYMAEVEQRRWYGFWDYGDVMHTYDPDRHMWRYDIGGYAWDNSELSPDLWIWYTYLRTGRADVFKFAEAMTRHTGEVDVYHLGPWKGFGTRHGIQHWSDSSKQPRVSSAVYRRIYYYLTADERVGDLMRDLVDSEYSLKNVDIARKLPPERQRDIPEGKVAAGFGTTWFSFASAWLSEWERTGDVRWRDRIVSGLNSIGEIPRGWFAGNAVFDLKSGQFIETTDRISVSHLNSVFGAVEMNMEILELVDAPAYRKAWLEYCRYYNAPSKELEAHLGKAVGGRGLTEGHSRLTAYAAHMEQDKALALRAWAELFTRQRQQGDRKLTDRAKPVSGPHVLRPLNEDPTLSTNGVSQWGLAAIQNLALVGDYLDEAAQRAKII
ncbi:MAG: Tat pathway signal sequence domain protein [Asticcacaulis sp.]